MKLTPNLAQFEFHIANLFCSNWFLSIESGLSIALESYAIGLEFSIVVAYVIEIELSLLKV